MWGEKSLQNTGKPTAREHLTWKTFMMYISPGTVWLKNGRGRCLKKRETNIYFRNPIIITERESCYVQQGHSAPNRRQKSETGTVTHPTFPKPTLSLWGLTQWLGTKKSPECFPQKVLDWKPSDFIHSGNSNALEGRGTWSLHSPSSRLWPTRF